MLSWEVSYLLNNNRHRESLSGSKWLHLSRLVNVITFAEKVYMLLLAERSQNAILPSLIGIFLQPAHMIYFSVFQEISVQDNSVLIAILNLRDSLLIKVKILQAQASRSKIQEQYLDIWCTWVPSRPDPDDPRGFGRFIACWLSRWGSLLLECKVKVSQQQGVLCYTFQTFDL